MKNFRENQGITLIALVITIIVLLILAGVTIATLTGDNGILTRTQEANNKTEQVSEDESRKLTQLEAATYLEDHEYIDNSTGEEKTITIPAQCAVSQVEGENTLKEGLVIIDVNGNEWVWIEVPKSIYDNSEYYTTGATKPVNSEDYENIEKIMQVYSTDYRRTPYLDGWYSEEQNGFKTEEEYTNLKNAMLKSVYENGGFYIGRYETGSFDEPVTSNDNNRKAVIKKGVYPYNYVTCKQAQEISESLTLGEKKSSLMFGIQWDLVLKYLEMNGDWDTTFQETLFYLKTNSSSWGNYRDVEFPVKEGNKYAIYGISTDKEQWNDIPENYIKPTSSAGGVILSTGATERNCQLNIYDLAGNLWEWTLERGSSISTPCIRRGGSYNNAGASYSAYTRSSLSAIFNDNSIGFRTVLY